MGLFGSRTKTYYNSTSALLFQDTPGIVKQTVASSITQNRNIATDLVANLVNGISFNATRLYEWAKHGSNFPWGLPDGAMNYISPQSQTYVKQVIQQELIDSGSSMQVHHLIYAIIEVDTTTEKLMYKAEYQLADKKGVLDPKVYTWTYDPATDVYPLLTLREEDLQQVSPYYPIIPIMVNQVYQAESGSANRAAITNACRYLNIKPDDLHDGIMGDPDNPPDNPVEDAYVILGVEITDDKQVSMEYMHRFFSYMYGIQNVHEEDFTYWEGNQNTDDTDIPVLPPHNRIELKDANYKMELDWLYITRKTKTMTIGKQGWYESDHTSVPSEDVTGTDFYFTRSSLTLRKQLTPTEVEEITVVGLVHSNWALGKEIRTTVADAFGSTDVAPSFFIPLRRDLLRDLGGIKTHDLMYRSIRMVINDKQTIKLKWYETGFFKIFITIVGVVLTIFYPPAGIAALSAAAVGVALVQVIAMKLLMPLVAKALEDIVGAELALLVSVLAVAYGASFSLTEGFQLAGLTTQGVMMASVVAVGGMMGLDIADQMQQIANEIEVMEDEMDIMQQDASDRQRTIMQAINMVSGDPYGIMDAQNYVARNYLYVREPTLIRDTVHNFTDIALYTDRPDSYIRLGHYGV